MLREALDPFPIDFLLLLIRKYAAKLPKEDLDPFPIDVLLLFYYFSQRNIQDTAPRGSGLISY